MAADRDMKKEPNQRTIQFARQEAAFFKRLVQVDNEFEVDNQNFSSLLNSKMRITSPERKAEAVKELNQLLSYMRGAIYEYAKDIADKAAELPDDQPEE